MPSSVEALARSALYERTVVRYLLGPWAPQLIELAELELGERVLDLATCNGTVARLAARCVGPTGTVTAVDPDGQALAFARSQAPSTGATPSATIEWLETRAEELGLPERSVDVALCQQGLQFFEDRPRALAELRRALASRGRVVFSCWIEANPLDRAVREALRPRVSDEVAEQMQRFVSLNDPDELRTLFVDAGFRRVRVLPCTMGLRYPSLREFLPQRLQFGGTRETVAAMNAGELHELVEEVIEMTRGFALGSGIVVPSRTHLITASAA